MSAVKCWDCRRLWLTLMYTTILTWKIRRYTKNTNIRYINKTNKYVHGLRRITPCMIASRDEIACLNQTEACHSAKQSQGFVLYVLCLTVVMHQVISRWCFFHMEQTFVRMFSATLFTKSCCFDYEIILTSNTIYIAPYCHTQYCLAIPCCSASIVLWSS